MIFVIVLCILCADYLLESALEILNLKHKPSKLPSLLANLYTAEKYNEAILYQQKSVKLGLVQSSFSFLFMFAIIYTGTLGKLDSIMVQHISNAHILSLTYFGLIFLISDIINTPFQYYKNFVIETAFGFNKMKPATFFLDKLKGYLITTLLGGAILWILLVLIESFGTNFWIYFWIIISVFLFFTNMLYTTLFVPLFNKLTPLNKGELRDAIESYCKKVDFPLNNIYVIDGSKRSSKANAFFSGIGKQKKIVLYDTLIEKHTENELVAILAHEVGHYKKKHIISGLTGSIISIGIILFVLSLFMNSHSLSKSLGGQHYAIHLNLIAFSILFTPISKVAGLIMNAVSRKNEYEADAYAAKTYDASPLKTALESLSVTHLSNLTPHPAYVFFHYSHPPLLQRLIALNKVDETKR